MVDSKVDYLNEVLNDKNIYKGPKFLYKYRPFNEFTFDMLDNNYLYLCPVEKLDDKSECNTSLDYERLIDLETNNLKRECVNQIVETIKSYTSEENYMIAKTMISSILNSDGTVRPNFMLGLSFELQKLAPEFDVVPFINWIVGIPKKLDDPFVKPKMESLVSIALNAKKEMGICSLSESPCIEEMWNNYYAGNETGYCVEYEISNYELKNLIMPVVYNDIRDTNVIIQLLASFIGEMIYGFSNGQINADRSQFIRLFLTKNTTWSYQKEWRLIDTAGDKIKAPNIKSIYLGKNVKEEDEQKMVEWCNKRSIKLIKRDER